MANPNKPDQPKEPQSSHSQGDTYKFRCADAGHKECQWETRGSSPDEVLRNVEQHGREKHNITSMDADARNKVMSNIQRAA